MIEIDGVKRALELPVTEAGDYISDTYIEAIDLSTSPRPLTAQETEKLASSIRRLNRNLASTSLYLYTTDLAPVYDQVVNQLNDINTPLGIGQLLPLMDASSGFMGSSVQFKFG